MVWLSYVGLALLCCGPVDGLNFLSIGDWGDSAAKDYVAKIMADYGDSIDAEFVLALGDNIYDRGAANVDDPQFASKFENTFTGDSLQVPWYMCGGNHDYYGNITAQIAYSSKSSRWTYDDYYFSKDLTGKDGTTMTLVSIDTWRLNGGDTYIMHDPVSGRSALRSHEIVHEAVARGRLEPSARDQIFANFQLEDPSKPVALNADEEQIAWIESTLSNSTATWKVVIGHFPVYSATRYEHGDTPSLINTLASILEKYNVDMYMNGHDHIQQHIIKSSVNYFGNGNGARTHSQVDKSYSGLQGYSDGKYGFMVHTANSTELRTTFVVNENDSASEAYSYIIRRGSR